MEKSPPLVLKIHHINNEICNKQIFYNYLRMSSPDLFLQSITLIIIIAISVMPATAAITIHNVLFLSFPCPTRAALSGAEGDVDAVNHIIVRF